MQTKTKYNIKYIQKVQHTKLCSQKFGDVFFLNATKLLKLTINTGSLGSAGIGVGGYSVIGSKVTITSK